MKEVYTKIHITLLLGFLLVFYADINAQKISEKLCNSIFDSASSVMKPLKIYRRHIFSTDCDFEFDIKNGTAILLSVEAYENEKQSEKAFIEESSDTYGDPRKKKVASLTSVKYWDDIGLFFSKRKFDSYLLLRKNRFVIQIFSDDQQKLIQLEKVLRGVSFEY